MTRLHEPQPSSRTGKGDREAVEEVFILHLPCLHDIIDIGKEAIVDGCLLLVSQNDRTVWAVIFLCVYPCLRDRGEGNAGEFDSFAKIM